MITAILTATMIITGWASQYAPGVMDRVVHVRQYHHSPPSLPIEHESVAGYIAVQSCAEMGNIWWIKPIDQDMWEPHMVADCSGSRETSEWMLRNNILLELSWDTVLRWGGKPRRGMRIERLILPNGGQ